MAFVYSGAMISCKLDFWTAREFDRQLRYVSLSVLVLSEISISIFAFSLGLALQNQSTRVDFWTTCEIE